ncbi:hypothetical protein ACI2UY_22620 [Ralstonia nicotianae]
MSPSRRLFRPRAHLAYRSAWVLRGLATAGRGVGILVFLVLDVLSGGGGDFPRTRRGWGALVLAAGVLGGVVWWHARR